MKRTLFAALAVLAVPAAATVKDGVMKWQAGDDRGAVAEWLPYAARGDSDAMFNLAQAYKLGRGVVLNTAVAQEYFRRAAERGHAPAQERLGLILFASPATRGEALRWLAQAAQLDQPRALYVVGVALFNGEGLPRDWARAYGYMARASAKGVPQAAAALQTMNANIAMADRAKGEQIAAELAKVELPSVAATSPERPPKIAATPAKPAAVAGRVASGWRVQLGAFPSQDVADSEWVKIRAARADLLGTATPLYQQAGPFLRLQVGPYPSRAAAKAFCAKLTAAGTACFVIAV